MKKICGLSVSVFIAVVSSVVALLATVTTLFVIKEKKKKDDAELERYLEDSIQ